MSFSGEFVTELAFVTGTYDPQERCFTVGNFDLGTQPFSVAVRFFGEHIAVDAGAIIMFEILKESFPILWLSFVYNFEK